MIAKMSSTSWQSRWEYLFCVAFLVITFFFAAVVPPFQAPDEFEHVKREYMLSQGQILLHSSQGEPSGGLIDSGLMAYMGYFTPIKGDSLRKVSRDELLASTQVRWAGTSSFEVSAVSGSYFPALYAPAAMGFMVGKTADLSVSQSYRLARYFSLIACTLLLVSAIRLWAPPPAVLALFALPMNLFLVSASVLDGVALATFTLGMSAFYRVVHDRENASDRTFALLTICIALVAACRANALAMLLLPFVGALYTRKRAHGLYAGMATLFAVAWTLYTVSHTVYPSTGRHVDNAARLMGFMTHPGTFLKMLFNTVTDMSIVSFYGYSFIGILGWFDAALPLWVYPVLAAILGVAVVASVNVKHIRHDALARSAVLAAIIGTLLLTFLALLVQWTPAGATRIDGVQGRYFMIPAVALGYSLAAGAHAMPRLLAWTGRASVAVLLAASALITTTTAIARYHTAAVQPERPETALSVSEPLTPERPITIHMDGAQAADPAPLSVIAIRFGTYMESHSGDAELRLWTADGTMSKQTFALSSLTDNAYRRFRLDGGAYVRGEVRSVGGGGVSIYEAKDRKGSVLSCIVLETTRGIPHRTAGCPDTTD